MKWLDELNSLWVPPAHPVMALTEEWRLARRGRLTASTRPPKVMNRRSWPTLKRDILAELSPDYRWSEMDLPAMQWGRDHEKAALSNLELMLGLDGEFWEPGFMLHPTRPYVGATPDGLIDVRATSGPSAIFRTTVQVKCPYKTDNHMRTVLSNYIADQYWMQVQWEAWVSRAQHILFVSYDPRVSFRQQLATVPVEVDYDLQKQFATACDAFHEFMDGDLAAAPSSDIDSLAASF